MLRLPVQVEYADEYQNKLSQFKRDAMSMSMQISKPKLDR
jgi:hypothetical protein